MRAVVQRVLNASVEVDNQPISTIDNGLLILVGFYLDDSEKDMDYIIKKILGLRIFNDTNNIMNLSINDVNGKILVVPQFTLYGDARKGNRPSYSQAMPPEKAKEFYNNFLEKFKSEYIHIDSGVFGADMKVKLVNSGPITILLDSHKAF